MNRIDMKFNELKKLGKKALITFVTAGDPDLDSTRKIVEAMEDAGADIIELGIPYSDPIAEGPVIQRANVRALENGIRVSNIMDMVREMRTQVKVPLIYLLYFNCILQYGVEKFFNDCRESGVDGVIIPDLPYEERDEIDAFADKSSIIIITLVSPTSKERVQCITKSAKGFLYCVSSLGVTGMRGEFKTDFDSFFSNINKYTDIPKAIGFGISTPEHIKKLKSHCDGLIVGSAIVKEVESGKYEDERVKRVRAFIQELRAALDD